MTIDTLYRVTSIIDDWPHRNHRYNGVGVSWVRHTDRYSDADHAAVAPMIKDAEKLSDDGDWLDAIGQINELFTHDEAEALSRYLLETHNTPTTIEPVRVPVEVRCPEGSVYMPVSHYPMGGARDAYMLSHEEGYALPFEVYGYYAVQEQWDSRSTGAGPGLPTAGAIDRTTCVIFYNSLAAKAPCPFCGKHTDPQVGFAIGLRNSWRPLCWLCRRQHAPELADMLDLFGGPLVLLEDPTP